MTTFFGKSCSFGLLCVSLVNLCQFLSMYFFRFWFWGWDLGFGCINSWGRDEEFHCDNFWSLPVHLFFLFVLSVFFDFRCMFHLCIKENIKRQNPPKLGCTFSFPLVIMLYVLLVLLSTVTISCWLCGWGVEILLNSFSLSVPFTLLLQNNQNVLKYSDTFYKFRKYSRTSKARTPMGPW